jgi:hypothetical protein
VVNARPDCFWCGSELFISDDLLVCPLDAASFPIATYTDLHIEMPSMLRDVVDGRHKRQRRPASSP